MFINLFISQDAKMNFSPEVVSAIKYGLLFCWIFFIFDGLTWLFAGILTAGGDTRFIMIANAVNSWFFAVTPMHIAVVWMKSPPKISWVIIACYSFINALLFFLRYKQGKWQHNAILIHDHPHDDVKC